MMKETGEQSGKQEYCVTMKHKRHCVYPEHARSIVANATNSGAVIHAESVVCLSNTLKDTFQAGAASIWETHIHS